MTTLSDLTLAQLAATYGAVLGIPTGPRTFNSRAKAQSRVEALLTERNLTLVDALRAAGIAHESEPTQAAKPANEAPEIEADEDGCEPEQTGPYGEDDIPGTEDPPEPGMVWDEDSQTWAYPEEPEESEDSIPTAEAPDAAAILANPQVSADIQILVFKHLTSIGLSEEEAGAAACRVGNALVPPTAAPRAPKAPRTGTKQEQVIALLRRPEGATIAQIAEATGWTGNSCRGFLAGGLKKRLGLTITSTKEAGGQRSYYLPA